MQSIQKNHVISVFCRLFTKNIFKLLIFRVLQQNHIKLNFEDYFQKKIKLYNFQSFAVNSEKSCNISFADFFTGFFSKQAKLI